jgi:hypothetical protein
MRSVLSFQILPAWPAGADSGAGLLAYLPDGLPGNLLIDPISDG